MKKSLIALAALAVVSAASAQSSVTLYGVADMMVGKTDAVGAKVKASSGGLAASRWGVKGSEDLGGGLKAHFNFESAVDLTTGAASGTPSKAMFDRGANISLSGGFGTVTLGKRWSALDDVFGAANSGLDSALSANAVWTNGYAYTADAQIHYATPGFSGFSAAVSTQLGGNTTSGKTTAFNIKYANGPVAAALGYENNQNTSAPYNFTAQKGIMLNGSYDLGKAKVMASMYNTTPDVGAKTNSFQLGADIPVSSALKLSVGYAASKVNGAATTSRGYGVAAGYTLSKRTMLYAGIRASNVVGKDLYAVGVNHSF